MTMVAAELALRLAQANDQGRARLLEDSPGQARLELAQALRQLYLESYSSDPQQAAAAAAALAALADGDPTPEIQALADWIGGMAALQLEGQIERAIVLIDSAAARFESLGQPHTAASTQVSKVYALARLGRYDQALACGLRARDVFLSYGNTIEAGKIELNLGNLHHRRDQYGEAERFYQAAHARFLAIGDQRLLAYTENGLANVASMQHNFQQAAQLYTQALARAESAGLEITQAEIECNLGSLELFQGRFDRALDYLEQSRRRYAALDMPHESAIAEQELADAYLELNLAPEASAIYARAIATFAELGMRAEQARALLHDGRASLALGRFEQARQRLAAANRLYTAEGNLAGAALVTLAEAQLAYAEGDYLAVRRAAARAARPLARAGMWGRLLSARWLSGEAHRLLGRPATARRVLAATLRGAERRQTPQIAQLCHTSLGLLAAAAADPAGAEQAYLRAIGQIETMRARLPADEFRTAFAADKLTPYTELVRLCLADQGGRRSAEALGYVERERSRALVDMLGGVVRSPERPRDQFEAKLLARMGELRQQLNWFYSQLNRAASGEAGRGPEATLSLQAAIDERESEVSQIRRQLQQRSAYAGSPAATPGAQVEGLDIAWLQRTLAGDTALVEYFVLDGELLAFVVTGDRVQVVRGLGREEQIATTLEQFRFQIGALRHGAAQLAAHLPQLAARARHHLAQLHALLFGPIEPLLGERRLIIVPHHVLHYVPFHALYDGAAYVIERREIAYAPSASVLRYCCARPPAPIDHAVLIGHADEQAPRVRDELRALAELFPRATVLADQQATLAGLRATAPAASLLHLACHGQFRPDNPLFSALQLADGWLTVRDAYGLDLRCELVALSACETGVSAVAPGDELIGLARGFFSAGTPALLVSLWAVDDAATAALMQRFYARLRGGARPAAALRSAQCELLHEQPHPFFWSPFILIGRW
jgi:CHAT domain-containing protein